MNTNEGKQIEPNDAMAEQLVIALSKHPDYRVIQRLKYMPFAVGSHDTNLYKPTVPGLTRIAIVDVEASGGYEKRGWYWWILTPKPAK